MLTNQQKKYSLKIPKYISLIYLKKKNTLLINSSIKKNLIELPLKIFIDKPQKLLTVSSIPVPYFYNKIKKNIKEVRGTTLALLKHSFIEASIKINQKLHIKGVSYRIAPFYLNNKLLALKLGYSHLLFMRIPDTLNIICLNKTKLGIVGNCYKTITQLSANIRKHKYPEPYKGKGILYEDEKIILKEGKKV